MSILSGNWKDYQNNFQMNKMIYKKHNMKKQYRWLMLIGMLSMSFNVFTRSFLTVPEGVVDFFKGFGIAIVLGVFFLEVIRKHKSKSVS